MTGKVWEGSAFAAWIQGSWHRSLTSSLLFSPAVPTSAKLATTPGGMASICSCIGMWRRAGSWCGYGGDFPRTCFFPSLGRRHTGAEAIEIKKHHLLATAALLPHTMHANWHQTSRG